MIILIVLLLVLWLGLGVVGFVVKGLLWLALIAIVLFILTGIWGFVSGRSRR
jgi:hypothetical protein